MSRKSHSPVAMANKLREAGVPIAKGHYGRTDVQANRRHLIGVGMAMGVLLVFTAAVHAGQGPCGGGSEQFTFRPGAPISNIDPLGVSDTRILISFTPLRFHIHQV